MPDYISIISSRTLPPHYPSLHQVREIITCNSTTAAITTNSPAAAAVADGAARGRVVGRRPVYPCGGATGHQAHVSHRALGLSRPAPICLHHPTHAQNYTSCSRFDSQILLQMLAVFEACAYTKDYTWGVKNPVWYACALRGWCGGVATQGARGRGGDEGEGEGGTSHVDSNHSVQAHEFVHGPWRFVGVEYPSVHVLPSQGQFGV